VPEYSVCVVTYPDFVQRYYSRDCCNSQGGS